MVNLEPKGIYVARWEVESHSSERKYIVSMKNDGTWACDCPFWKFHKAPKPICKHIEGVQREEPRATAEKVAEVHKVATKPQTVSVFVLQTRRAIRLAS